LKTTKSELIKAQGSQGELKKKVAALEEALSKANNDLGKSQVCNQQVILFASVKLLITCDCCLGLLMGTTQLLTFHKGLKGPK